MKPRLSARIAIVTLVLASALHAQQTQNSKATGPLDKFPKVVALVNGHTITREKLAQDCLKRYGTIVLDNLLNKRLILQACEAQGIKITQADVNNEIARVANKVGLTTKLFLEALESERDITPEQYASEIIWPMLALRALAAGQIQVTQEEIDQVLKSEYGAKVQVRMIALDDANKAQQIHAQAVAAPDTFRRLAKQHSIDPPSAAVEGLLPPIRQNSGDDQLERVAFQLQPNQISPVFQIGEQHIMLQCVRHYKEAYPNPQTLPVIRARVEEQLRDQRLGKAADGIFERLQANAQVVKVLGNPEYEKKYKGVAAYINRQPVPLVDLAAACMSRHGKEILRGEISRYLLETELKKSGKEVTQRDIEIEVARAADMNGFIRPNGTPDIDAWYKSIQEEEGATVELYWSDAVWPSVALKKLVEGSVAVDQEDMKKGFESNFGPRAEVLAIVLSSQRAAQDVFSKARNALDAVKGDMVRSEQAFGELAAEFSVEPVSRSNFGKIPAVRKWSGQEMLEKAAFELLPGEISGILAWGDQYAILYKQGESKPLVQDFGAVQEELHKEILEKKLRVAMRQRLDQLLKDSQIDNLLEGTAQNGKVVPASATRAATSK